MSTNDLRDDTIRLRPTLEDEISAEDFERAACHATFFGMRTFAVREYSIHHSPPRLVELLCGQLFLRIVGIRAALGAVIRVRRVEFVFAMRADGHFNSLPKSQTPTIPRLELAPDSP